MPGGPALTGSRLETEDMAGSARPYILLKSSKFKVQSSRLMQDAHDAPAAGTEARSTGEKEWVGRLSLAATLLPVRKLRYKKLP